MLSHGHLQYLAHLPSTDTRRLAHSLLNQIILESQVARAKIESCKEYIADTDILQLLTDVQHHLVAVNREIEPLAKERELYSNSDDNKDFCDFLDSWWGSD